jgi:carboxypeptidase Taq
LEGNLDANNRAVPWVAHVGQTTVLTKDIAQRSAELTSKGYQSWVKARQESDFSLFAPMLEDWVSLLKEKCALIDDSKPVYDVCLDDYERGLTAARLDEVFAQVKAGLVPLLDDIRTKGRFLQDQTNQPTLSQLTF